jgi:hypothetical protein
VLEESQSDQKEIWTTERIMLGSRCNILDTTKFKEKAMKEIIRFFKYPEKRYKRGDGITVGPNRVISCLIIDPDSGQVLARGMSLCSFEESPNDKKGRMIALARARLAGKRDVTQDGKPKGFIRSEKGIDVLMSTDHPTPFPFSKSWVAPTPTFLPEPERLFLRDLWESTPGKSRTNQILTQKVKDGTLTVGDLQNFG